MDPTPADIAHFDQSMAEINRLIDALTEAHKDSLRHFRHEEVIVAMAQTIDAKTIDKQQTAQYLAVAIHRIAELQQATIEIMTKYETETGQQIPGIVFTDND